MSQIVFQNLTRPELEELLLPLVPSKKRDPAKTARFHAKQIYSWVYQRMVTDWDEMSDLSKPIREWLKQNVELKRLEERVSKQSQDGTKKWLWKLYDGKTIESVIIPAALSEKTTWEGSNWKGEESDDEIDSENWTRLTACISSQVGCAMACKFCLTGVQGLDRHLEVYEIVCQIHELRRLAPVSNIVFMGMGEPLHNVDNVIKACQILLDEHGLNFSKRKITVSTSGLVPAIDRLGEETDVSLAISLNGTTDAQREEIMPVNRKWDLKELLNACKRYPLGSHRRITFEYVLLKGVNDADDDAYRLTTLLRGIRSKVNLIPFNEHSGSVYKRPDERRVRKFQKILLDNELTATVRISRGQDILAACGQLRSLFGTARGTEKHKDAPSLSQA
jgi:23S rRNA (adenine2503-C2)-methyltransferase